MAAVKQILEERPTNAIARVAEILAAKAAAPPPPTARNEVHQKARSQDNPAYPQRFAVPDEKVPWSVEWPSYAPVEFVDTTKGGDGNELWFVDHADPKHITANSKGGPQFNSGKRTSYLGNYAIDETTGRPLNPRGRTGISNRGKLDVWGPAFAADPVVTRYDPETGCLQMVAVKRRDNGQYAIPGGFTDYNEPVSGAAKREFKEEAANFEGEAMANFEAATEELFANGTRVYGGYVDDPRTTDNTWIETVVFHYHCPPELGGKMKLSAGDDAARAIWLDISEDEPRYRDLYASHKSFVEKAIEMAALPLKKP